MATGTLGQQSGNLITLDYEQLNSVANKLSSESGINPYKVLFIVGSSTVAHEIKHYEDRAQYGGSARDRVASEKRAYRIGDQVINAFGLDGLGWKRGRSDYDYYYSVERRAKLSCIAGMISQGVDKDKAVASCVNQ